MRKTLLHTEQLQVTYCVRYQAISQSQQDLQQNVIYQSTA